MLFSDVFAPFGASFACDCFSVQLTGFFFVFFLTFFSSITIFLFHRDGMSHSFLNNHIHFRYIDLHSPY